MRLCKLIKGLLVTKGHLMKKNIGNSMIFDEVINIKAITPLHATGVN